ncbi:MAG: carboxypeptidase-like regulatory domain-containing protein, partial [Bacteroidota bacterium]
MNQTNSLRRTSWYSGRNIVGLLTICLLASNSLWAQKTVSGTVTNDLDGSPLSGVTITILGTTEGAFTNELGQYSVDVPGDDAVLVFSFLGYGPVEETVGNRTTIDIGLTEVGLEADEVVITALGIERDKRSLGYSVTEVDGESLSDAQTLSVANALQGRVAGVNIQQGGSGPSGATRVIIRGNASLTGNNQPLYVIDGVIIDNSVLGSAGAWGGRDYGDAISNINPEE